MADTTTLTIRVPVELKDELDQLARDTRRTRSFLAAEAVTDYVTREREIIAGIMRGIEDMKAGRTIPHDEAMARLRAKIDSVRRAKAK